MLSPNDPSFFEPVLSPNAPACRSAGLTPVSISNMTAPPGPKTVLFTKKITNCAINVKERQSVLKTKQNSLDPSIYVSGILPALTKCWDQD